MMLPFPPRSRHLIHRSRALLAAALLAAAVVAGCKDSTPTGSDDNGTPVDSVATRYYIQAKIDGALILQQEADGSTSTDYYAQEARATGQGAGSGSGYFVVQSYDIGHLIYVGQSVVADPKYSPIIFNFMKNFDGPPSGSQIDALLGRGTLPFGDERRERDGIEIRWVDSLGTEWSTAFGSADQTGSSFTVTDHVRNPAPTSVDRNHYVSKGTFSAKLYNGKGSMIRITDGEFSLRTIFD